MRKRDIQIATFGIACNLSLFLIKLYVGISSNSLAIYCDSVNNLGDTFSALIALFGFIFYYKIKINERKKQPCSGALFLYYRKYCCRNGRLLCLHGA